VEFVNSVPYTPKDRNNMIALLVARNDGAEYGKLVLFQLPKGQIVMGPSQIDAQIAQHTDISRDFALWENAGSTYSRGNMFVIPIENSFMYVEPIYLRATIGSLPEVKRIVIYFNERIAYEQTLREALDSMFGPGVGDAAIDGIGLPAVVPDKPTPPPPPDTTTGGTTPVETPPDDTISDSDIISLFDMTEEELIIAASEAYNRGQDALRRGDWAAYGEAQEELEAILTHLIVRFGG